MMWLRRSRGTRARSWERVGVSISVASRLSEGGNLGLMDVVSVEVAGLREFDVVWELIAFFETGHRSVSSWQYV